MVWLRWCLLLGLSPAACLLSLRQPALRRATRLAAEDDEKIINIEDLPELGACGEPKKRCVRLEYS